MIHTEICFAYLVSVLCWYCFGTYIDCFEIAIGACCKHYWFPPRRVAQAIRRASYLQVQQRHRRHCSPQTCDRQKQNKTKYSGRVETDSSYSNYFQDFSFVISNSFEITHRKASLMEMSSVASHAWGAKDIDVIEQSSHEKQGSIQAIRGVICASLVAA